MNVLIVIGSAICGAIIMASWMQNSCPYECDFCHKRDKNQSYKFRP